MRKREKNNYKIDLENHFCCSHKLQLLQPPASSCYHVKRIEMMVKIQNVAFLGGLPGDSVLFLKEIRQRDLDDKIRDVWP